MEQGYSPLDFVDGVGVAEAGALVFRAVVIEQLTRVELGRGGEQLFVGQIPERMRGERGIVVFLLFGIL